MQAADNNNADIENQNPPAEENHGNTCYDNSLICLARWLPCMCGGAEMGIMAAIGFIVGQDRANALGEAIHNLFAWFYNGARAAIVDEEVDENADDLDDEMGAEHPDVAEFARNADELVVTGVEAARVFVVAILNGFLARYTPATPATRIAIETLCATLATDIEWLVRYGIINPGARFTVTILDWNGLIYGLFVPPREDDAPPLQEAINAPEVINPPEEEAPGWLNRLVGWFYPAYEEDYEEDNNNAAPHADPDEEEQHVDNEPAGEGVVANDGALTAAGVVANGDALTAGGTASISKNIQQNPLSSNIANNEQQYENKDIVENKIEDNDELSLLLETIFFAWNYMPKWLQEKIIKSAAIQTLLQSETEKEAIYNPKSVADNFSQLFIQKLEVNTTNEAEDNQNEKATYAKASFELIDTSFLYNGVTIGICILPMIVGASNNPFADLINIE